MCFHNSLSSDALEIENRFNIQFDKKYSFKPVYYVNAFSYPLWPVITTEKPDKISAYKWGLIPHWIKSPKEALQIRAKTLNARAETVFEKPSFLYSVSSKRCLVLSGGFYEWYDLKSKKYPFFVSLKTEKVFALAGIYQDWVNKDSGEMSGTFSILTTESNELMSKIHNIKKRMPVIIPREMENLWLQTNLSPENIKAFFMPFDVKNMKACSVSRLITSKTEKSDIAESQKEFIYHELIDSNFYDELNQIQNP